MSSANSSSTAHAPSSGGLHNFTPPKWLGLLSDVLLWGLIALIFATLVYLLVIKPRQAAQQTVALSFRDANEISRGALVRMMGSTIGYVEDIDLRRNRVNVVVKTEPGGITIPKGSTFTINFTGLVGSKNIEVIPPNSPTTGREDSQGDFFVEEPIRLRDAQDYQIEIARALQHGAENFSDFFGKQQPIEELQHNIRIAERKTAEAEALLASAKTRTDKTSRDLHNGLSQINKAVTDFSISSREAARVTSRNDFGSNVITVVGTISRELLKGQKDMASFVGEHHLQRYQKTADEMDNAFARICEHITPPLWYAAIDRQNQSLLKADQALTSASENLTSDPILLQMRQFQQVLLQLNTSLVQWNTSIEKKQAAKKGKK